MGPRDSRGRETYQGHVSWREVLRHWQEMQQRTGHKPLLVAELCESVTGQPILRGIVSCTCSPHVGAAFGFGPGSNESATTLPSTLLEALTGLEVAWEVEREFQGMTVVRQKRGPEDED